MTIYEFLNSAEIVYMGWENSIQRANRLYNRYLSEEIKSKLINKSDSYQEYCSTVVLLESTVKLSTILQSDPSLVRMTTMPNTPSSISLVPCNVWRDYPR